MANFNSMVLTNKGQILYAKGQAGATINFTKLAVGIGNVGSTDPTTLTELINHKFDIAIQGKTVNTLEKVALISGTLTNENMTESVYIQEIGLYAQDPDEGEILYSYASAGKYGDYTSPASNGPYAWNYQVYAAIGNAANIEVTLSNLQYDTGIVNTNTTLSIIKGSTQKDLNKSIDNKFKPYTTTNNGNVYTITSLDIDTLTDGYPILVRFNADSTGNASLIVNGSSSMDLVDYFGNKVSNIRHGLIVNVIYDAANRNFQLLGKGGEGDATSDQVLDGKKVTVNSGILTGSMPNVGSVAKSLAINETYNIPKGFHDGTGKVTQSIQTKGAATITPGTTNQVISANQFLSGDQIIAGDSDLIASNILDIANIFGVQGTAKKKYAASGVINYTIPGWTGTKLNHTFYPYSIDIGFTPDVFVWSEDNSSMTLYITPIVTKYHYNYNSTDDGWDSIGISGTSIWWANEHSSPWTVTGSWMAFKFN